MENFIPIVPPQVQGAVFAMFLDPPHTGPENTFESISNFYFWIMWEKTSSVDQTLPKFQNCKTSRHNRQALQNYPRNPQRLNTVHVDLVPLNTSLQFSYILTMKNRDTEFLVTVHLTDKSSASVKSALEQHHVSKFGVPTIIISDKHQEFNSQRF